MTLDLKALREERGLSQYQLAVEIGVQPSQISRWELAPHPSWDAVVRYLSGLGGATITVHAGEIVHVKLKH